MRVDLLIVVTTLAVLLQICDSIDLIKRLKKIKNFSKGNKKSSKEFKTWAIQRKEYPGQNKDLKKSIQDQWDAYYSCLEEAYEKFRNGISAEVTTHIIEEGKAISLECDICLSPAVSYMESVTWRKLASIDEPENSPPLGNDIYDEKYIRNPDDAELSILDLQAGSNGDAGLYACFYEGSMKAVHFLHVAGDDEPVIQVKPLTAPKGPHPRPYEEENGLTVFTDWQPWSPCTAPIDKKAGKCYKVGKQSRFGACKVALSGFHTEPLQANETKDISSNATGNATENIAWTKAQNNNDHIAKVLKIFGKSGIPCRSPMLSTLVWMIPKERPNEIMTAFCKLNCQNDVIDGTKDKIYYDTVESIPPLPPPVRRMVLFQEAYSEVILKCPSISVDDPSPLWKIGNLTVNAAELKTFSRGRLFIDVKEHFHIKSLRLQDANIYSCWHDDHLVATMKVHVTKKVRLTFNHHLALVIMVSILGVIVYIFLKVMANSLKKKVKTEEGK